MKVIDSSGESSGSGGRGNLISGDWGVNGRFQGRVSKYRKLLKKFASKQKDKYRIQGQLKGNFLHKDISTRALGYL